MLDEQTERKRQTFLEQAPYHVLRISKIKDCHDVRDAIEENKEYLGGRIRRNQKRHIVITTDKGKAVIFRSFKQATNQALRYLESLSSSEQKHTSVHVLSVHHVKEL